MLWYTFCNYIKKYSILDRTLYATYILCMKTAIKKYDNLKYGIQKLFFVNSLEPLCSVLIETSCYKLVLHLQNKSHLF